MRVSQIDAYVGERIRLRRRLLSMSQQQLAERLGLTTQQVEEHEGGVSRIGATRLFDLSRVLDVPIGFFFDDAPEPQPVAYGSYETSRAVGGFAESQDGFGGNQAVDRRETLELVQAYYRISDPAVRKRVFDLLKSLARAET
jgi:transcriptional regulator with XRE-family HTH domain